MILHVMQGYSSFLVKPSVKFSQSRLHFIDEDILVFVISRSHMHLTKVHISLFEILTYLGLNVSCVLGKPKSFYDVDKACTQPQPI